MKKTTHSNSVASVRPSRNRCSTGIPVNSGSLTTNRVAGANAAPGSINPSNCATRPSALPVSARNRTDSGSLNTSTGASSSGATPPTMNTERQPKCGIKAAASRPPSAAPIENPENMIITMVARRRRGLNSDVSAMVLGIAPPRPRPVRKRIASKGIDVLNEGGGQRADAECYRGKNDDLLAADAVRQRPQQQRTDHQSEQAGGEYRTERAPGQAPVPGDRGGDEADGLGVEAVEKQHRRAGREQPDLKSADRLEIDEFGNVDGRCSRSFRSRPFPCSP